MGVHRLGDQAELMVFGDVEPEDPEEGLEEDDTGEEDWDEEKAVVEGLGWNFMSCSHYRYLGQ